MPRRTIQEKAQEWTRTFRVFGAGTELFFFFWSYFKSVSQIINAVDIQDATDYLIRKGGVENMAYLRIVIPAAFKPSHISFEITLPNRKNLAWPYESYMNY